MTSSRPSSSTPVFQRFSLDQGVLTLACRDVELPIVAVDRHSFVADASAAFDALENKNWPSGEEPEGGVFIAADSSQLTIEFFVQETHEKLVRCRLADLSDATERKWGYFLDRLAHDLASDPVPSARVPATRGAGITPTKPATAATIKDVRADSSLRISAADSGDDQLDPKSVEESPSAKKNYVRLITWPAVLALAGLLVWSFSSGGKTSEPTLSFDDVRFLERKLPLLATRSGQLVEVLASRGETVNAEDALFVIEEPASKEDLTRLNRLSEELNLRLQAAQKTLVSLQAAVDLAREKAVLERRLMATRLKSAEAESKRIVAQLERLSDYASSGAVSRAEIEELVAQREAADALVESFVTELELAQLVVKSADEGLIFSDQQVRSLSQVRLLIEELKADRRELDRKIKLASEPMRRSTVSAGTAGLIGEIHVAQGREIQQGDTLGELFLPQTEFISAKAIGSSFGLGRHVSVYFPRLDARTNGRVDRIEADSIRIKLEPFGDDLASDMQVGEEIEVTAR
ncbi:MAG: hypothetical protein AAF802_06465 [Planctomycetota bacterium]